MNEKDIDEAVRKVFHTDVEPEDRRMVIWTDRKQMELFHKALKEEVTKQVNTLQEFHKKPIEVSYKEIQGPNENIPYDIYNKMDVGERGELFILSFNGVIDGGKILMGSEQVQKIIDFKNKMIQKYK